MAASYGSWGESDSLAYTALVPLALVFPPQVRTRSGTRGQEEGEGGGLGALHCSVLTVVFATRVPPLMPLRSTSRSGRWRPP